VTAGILLAGAAGQFGLSTTCWRSARNLLLPRLSGVGTPGHIALTFDDGPDPASTPAFLEALDRLGWQATFFMLGDMVQRAPTLAAEVAAAGHEVAVHGFGHRSHLRRGPLSIADDVARGTQIVAEATGTSPRWFRPPYGALSVAGLSAAGRLGLETVLWTTWGRDWRASADPATVARDVTRTLHPGATVLLHDSDCTSAPGSWRSALGALPLLAERFAIEGSSVGTLGRHGL
jgi:peptidoglycan/xylan/chitin deacetylase (PgdA/CDA1 family)